MKKIFTIVFLFFTVVSQAQDVVNLDPISITTSRLAQKISETGRSITIINGKTIEKLPVNSLDELLKYTAAVEVQQRGPAGAQADFVIRGGTFQQVLVLLDGIKINDPLTGHFSAYLPIAPSQIERIEILKGPAAAVYGSEAVGGVINIISKTFASYKKEKSTHATASVTGGEYGYIGGNAGFFKTDEKINFSLGAVSNNANGQLLRGNNRGYFHTNTFSANAGISLSTQWNLFLHSSYDNRDFAAQNFYTTFVSDTATEKVNTWWNHAKLKYSGLSSTDEIDVAYKKTSDHYLYNPVSVANENRSSATLLQYVHTKTISTSFFYNYGLSGEYKTIVSNDRGDHQNENASAFGSFIFKKNNLSLNPGLRIVSDKNYGTQLLPQTNIAYKINKLIMKANAGRAIRSADFTERYNNYNKIFVANGTIGNPDLTAEKSWSYEAGADLLLPHFKIGAAYFYRNQYDVIDYVPTPYSAIPRKINLSPAGTYAFAQNLKKVTTSGVEVELNYNHHFSETHTLFINAAATFLHSVSPEATPSFYIISHAKTLLQQTVVYNIKKISISFTSIYKQRMPQQAAAIKAAIEKAYWLVNTKLGYSYRIATAFVAINNIGNIQYSDLLGSKMPGSWTTAGLAVSF
ncbi:MAG: TonB-dependent receptor [Ferruginibacter sp.]